MQCKYREHSSLLALVPNNTIPRFDAVDEKSKTKPDVIIGFKYKKNHINCLLFEVKRPTATSKYQAENAHVKLLKQMKTSIDFQVKIRINSPASFGVLCRGSYWQGRSI